MGPVGKPAEGKVLPSHGGWKAQTANRSREMEQHGGRHWRNSGYHTGGSMTLWSSLRSWLRATLRRSRMESEMDAELRFHVEAYTEDLVRGGVPREEAMRRAGRARWGGAGGQGGGRGAG